MKGDSAVKQMYLPNTNVLITRFFHDAGMGEVTDFMSVGREAGGETEQRSRQLVRVAKAIRGPIPFQMLCRPAFDYAAAARDRDGPRRPQRAVPCAGPRIRSQEHSPASP